MHCKTDAINQVSLQCFIKSEGWSQGKSTAFVQILQIFTVSLRSWWRKGAAQQSLTSASIRIRQFLGQVWGDDTEQHLQSLDHEGILLGYPPAWHKAAVCSKKPSLCWRGGADSPAEVQKHPWHIHHAEGFPSFCLVLPALSLISFWLWLSTLQDLFVGGFSTPLSISEIFNFLKQEGANQFVWCFRTPRRSKAPGLL